MKKETLSTFESMAAITFVLAKGAAFIYIIGLCGGYEKGTLTLAQFVIRLIVSVAFLVLG